MFGLAETVDRSIQHVAYDVGGWSTSFYALLHIRVFSDDLGTPKMRGDLLKRY